MTTESKIYPARRDRATPINLAGERAYRAGTPVTQSGYPFNTSADQQWRRGWETAKADEEALQRGEFGEGEAEAIVEALEPQIRRAAAKAWAGHPNNPANRPPRPEPDNVA